MWGIIFAFSDTSLILKSGFRLKFWTDYSKPLSRGMVRMKNSDHSTYYFIKEGRTSTRKLAMTSQFVELFWL